MRSVQKKSKARPAKPLPFFAKATPLDNPETAKQRFLEKFNADLFEKALQVALTFIKISPNSVYGRSYAAVCCTRLDRWSEAVQYGLQALSLFDSFGGQTFPEGTHRDDFHTGYAEGSPMFSSAVDLPDGAVFTWSFSDQRQTLAQMICRYPATIQAKQINVHLPARYAKLINQGLIIKVETGA